MTSDSYEGNVYDPASLHKYLYVGADPTNKIDPSGNSSVDLVATLTVGSVISAMAVVKFLAIGVGVAAATCFLDLVGTSILREEGFDVSGLSPCSADNGPRITLFRGVNEKHVAYSDALLGIAKPNRRWWQFWKVSPVTPYEHNTVQDATLNSVFTAWTINPLVAEGYALWDQVVRDTISTGVVLEAQIPLSRTFPSPDLHKILHPMSRTILPEQEVLVRGVIRGAKVRRVP